MELLITHWCVKPSSAISPPYPEADSGYSASAFMCIPFYTIRIKPFLVSGHGKRISDANSEATAKEVIIDHAQRAWYQEGPRRGPLA